MDNNEFDYVAAAAEFSDERSVWKQIWGAIRNELFPNAKNWFGLVFSVFLSALLAYVIATSEETVTLLENVCGTLLDVQIAIFGCIFAVYSILLAFLSDDYIKKLLQIDYKNHSSYLKRSTMYYEAALFIYFVAIGISLVYKLIVQCMPQYYVLTENTILNEILAGICIFVYFVYSIRAIYELKSIVGNTLLLFRTSLQYRILAFRGNDNQENDTADTNENGRN